MKGLAGFVTKLVTTLVSEVLIEWMFFKVARIIVSHTKTPHDDEFLAKLEEIYYGKK